MTPRSYAFTSRWRIPAGPGRCWAETERMLRPGARSWWPGVRMSGRLRVGAGIDAVVRSPVGYRLRLRLTVTEVEPGRRVVARSAGDLAGEGAVELTGLASGGTRIVVRWQVATQRRWMNATAFVLRPMFALAHALVMRAGERGLRRAVGGWRSDARNADSSAFRSGRGRGRR